MSDGRRRGRLRTATAAGLLVALSVVVSLALMEGILRLLPPGATEAQAEPTYFYAVGGSIFAHGRKVLKVGLRPGALGTVITPEYRVASYINSLGYRDYEFTVTRPAGTLRVAVVGDSVAFGAGVEPDETFAKLLERRLAAHPPVAGRRVQVLNLGVGSYSGGQDYLMIRDEIARFGADLAILVHFANDAMEWPFEADADGLPRTYVVTPAVWKRVRHETADAGPRYPRIEAALGILERAGRHSRLSEFLARSGRDWLEARRRDARLRRGDPWRDPFWPLRAGVDLDAVPEWKTAEAIAAASHAAAARQGIPLLLVLVPSGTQVNGFEWDRGRTRHGFAVGRTARYDMERRLAALYRRNGWPLVDLLEVLRRHSREDARLYFRYDGHLTPRGHRVVARALEAPVARLLAERAGGGGRASPEHPR